MLQWGQASSASSSQSVLTSRAELSGNCHIVARSISVCQRVNIGSRVTFKTIRTVRWWRSRWWVSTWHDMVWRKITSSSKWQWVIAANQLFRISHEDCDTSSSSSRSSTSSSVDSVWPVRLEVKISFLSRPYQYNLSSRLWWLTLASTRLYEVLKSCAITQYVIWEVLTLDMQFIWAQPRLDSTTISILLILAVNLKFYIFHSIHPHIIHVCDVDGAIAKL